MSSTRLIRMAYRLSQLDAGSDAVDKTIHDALGLPGAARSYTTSEAAALSLLPVGFEWMQPVHFAGAVYVACRRSGTGSDLPCPHYGAWGRTTPLATCSAAMRVYAKLEQE